MTRSRSLIKPAGLENDTIESLTTTSRRIALELPGVLGKASSPQEAWDWLKSIDPALNHENWSQKVYHSTLAFQDFTEMAQSLDYRVVVQVWLVFIKTYRMTIATRKYLQDRNEGSENIAKVFQFMVEQQISQDLSEMAGRQITCRGKGCSLCCHQRVGSTIDEGSFLLNHHWDKIDWGLIEKQILYDVDSDYWVSQPKEQRPCVFLKGGACSIYEDRPLQCRVHFSSSPPEKCDVDSEETIKYLTLFRPEALISGYFSALSHSGGEIGSLARMLKIARDKRAY